MLIWAILFLVVMGVSFVLAFRSMSDYREVPAPSVPFSVFLVGNPQALTLGNLQKLGEAFIKGKFIFSFERLFKGPKRALVVFGPVDVLQPFSQSLGLTEIEDYSRTVTGKMRAWEVGKKSPNAPIGSIDILSYIPSLQEDEEFWWQVVLKPKANQQFTAIIRAVFRGSDEGRLVKLQEELFDIGKPQDISVLPQAYSSEKIIKFYQDRSLPLGSLSHMGQLTLSAEEVYSLLGI